MKVLFLNNDGAGFADYVEVEPNTAIEKFVGARLPEHTAAGLLIRVNRQPVSRDYVLQPGDRVTATPTKVEGADRPPRHR